jgi:DNA-binding NtrC family response regulator
MRAGVPIIAISGGGLMPKELLLSSAAAMGAVEVVSKPFEISRLVGAVDRALQQQPREEDS